MNRRHLPDTKPPSLNLLKHPCFSDSFVGHKFSGNPLRFWQVMSRMGDAEGPSQVAACIGPRTGPSFLNPLPRIRNPPNDKSRPTMVLHWVFP